MDNYQMLDLLLAQDFTSLWLDNFVPVLGAETSLVEQWGTRLYNIMLVAIGLGFVIFVHELGHFLAAKAFGVKCEKFYVGFDVPIKIGPIRLPSKLVHFQWGETEYGIGAIPLGGYVKMLGQDDDPRRAEEESKRIRQENPNASTEDPDRVKLDPRSLPAKGVGARMVIFSAGVIMNVIFGVLMAAWAFTIGVPYEPSVIGEVLPGDPAWKNGLISGDRIVQVDTMKDTELSFRDMFMSVLFHGLRDHKAEVEIGFDRDGKLMNKKFLGTTVHSDPKRGLQHLSIGMRSAAITQISSKEAISKHLKLASSSVKERIPKLMPSDTIVGINGAALEISHNGDKNSPMEYSLNKRLHPKLRETVSLKVHRDSVGGKDPYVDVEWQPIPMKSFGLRFKPGAVVAIMPDSPAAQAGVQEGDTLVAFEDKPIEDAFTLMLEAAAMPGKTATLTLEHSDKSKATLQWQVPEEFVVNTADGTLAPVGLELPGSGLVYSVSNIVSGVEPESVAAQSNIAVGDVVKQFQFDGEAKEDKEYLKEVFVYGSSELVKQTPVDKSHNIQYFHNLVQTMRTGMPVKINFEHDGKVATANVKVIEESKWYWPDRGINFTALKFDHKAENVASALAMGVHEIGRRGGNVLEFLELLVRGKMPFNVVGGPGMIAVEANDAASKGIAPLLMFLVMLSANLAIINFLPIPALDGGHMMFLAAEAVLGKPVDEALQMKLTMAGVLGLLCLMGAVIINDSINLTRIFGG